MNQKRILDQAKKKASNRKKLSELVTDASQKLKNLASNSPEFQELKSKVSVLLNMVKSHLSGEYSAFSNASLLLIVFGLVYFLAPIDFIPDFIPALGFSDDASVLYFIYQRLSKDIEEYLKWKESQ